MRVLIKVFKFIRQDNTEWKKNTSLSYRIEQLTFGKYRLILMEKLGIFLYDFLLPTSTVC